MYHYIFFDLDGTLTDSKEGILNSLRYAFDKLGEPVPPESTLIKFIGPPLQDSFAEFCGFSAERAAEAIAVFRERYEPVGKFENMAAPGMADLCARLKARGYVLALASSKPEKLCLSICERFGFTQSLQTIVGSPIGADWQKADVIREVMRRLGVTRCICSTVDYDTLELIHLNFGDNKVKAFKETYGEDAVPDEFYTDNLVDLPMLRYARKGFLVHGNDVRPFDPRTRIE